MSPLLIEISKDFATLWTTIDPIGNVALFAGLTALYLGCFPRRSTATINAASGHFDQKQYQSVRVATPGEFLNVDSVSKLVRRIISD
jgi:hypothetical protein